MGKINYYNNNMLCTEIFYNKPTEPLKIVNHTDNLFLRAFGVIDNPTWNDLEHFLCSRCFPEQRANKKDLLRILGVDSYNPWEICKKTEGRMVEDHQWLEFVD